MTRPNRYPYTRSQWIEITFNHFMHDRNTCFSQHFLENRLTKVIKSKEVE